MVLGQLYTVKHQPEKAEEQFKTAQAIEPESEEVVLNLARLYAESGDLQHAAKVIETVPEDGRTPKMEFTLGALYDQLKQLRRTPSPPTSAQRIWNRATCKRWTRWRRRCRTTISLTTR